jgi:hypothetical protein
MIAPMPAAMASPVQNERFMRTRVATSAPSSSLTRGSDPASGWRHFGAIVPWRTLDPSQPDRKPAAAAQPDADAKERAERLWRCAACGQGIAADASRDEVDGRHVHMRLNPAGVAFVFGIFREAPGCAVVGLPTDEATWFAGCLWRYALCKGCGAHLGWSFSGASGGFFGLVLEKLVEPGPEG